MENTMALKSLDNLIENISTLTVLELAELTKALEEKFGVSAAMPVAAAAPAAAGETVAAQEKTEYKVELIESGSEKIKVIKALRSVKKDLGLTDAKKIVESAPIVIAESVGKDEAQAMKEAIEAAGAKVKLS
jgi:large subunit ribosomal protein L7/L12